MCNSCFARCELADEPWRFSSLVLAFSLVSFLTPSEYIFPQCGRYLSPSPVKASERSFQKHFWDLVVGGLPIFTSEQGAVGLLEASNELLFYLSPVAWLFNKFILASSKLGVNLRRYREV